MISLKDLIVKKENKRNYLLKNLVEDMKNYNFISLREYIGHVKPSSPISYYIKRYEKLDPKEEEELIKRYQKRKDKKAFDRLIRGYSKYMLRLIMDNKRKLEKVNKNITTEEVFNAMIMNFAKAVKKFKPRKGYKFITYLNQWLKEVVFNYKHFISKSAITMKNKSKSIDMKIGKGSGKKRSLSDLIKDPEAVDLYSQREKEQFMKALSKKGFKALSKDERFVIKAKYGMLDPRTEDKLLSGKGKITYDTIGKYLNKTNVTIMNMHRRALIKLKKALS